MMEEEENCNNVVNNNKSDTPGVTLGESNTDANSCESLLEIVNYLDSRNFSIINMIVESESNKDCDVTVSDVRNVDTPDISISLITTNQKISSGIKRSASVISDSSGHIISHFLDKSVNNVGFTILK